MLGGSVHFVAHAAHDQARPRTRPSPPPPAGLRPRLPARHGAGHRLLRPEQVLRRAARAADRHRGGRRGQSQDLVRRPNGHRRPEAATGAAHGADHRDLARRIALPVPLRAEVARPGAEPAARDAHGGVHARAAAGDGVLRAQPQRQPAGRAQRGRQPDGALPQRRRQRPDPGVRRLADGGRRVLRAHGQAGGAGADPGAADPVRRVLVPAQARHPLHGDARGGGRDGRAAEQQPAGHRHHQGLHRGRLRGQAHRAGLDRVPRAQPRGDPAVGGHHAGDPHRHPGRIQRHDAVRRADDAGRRAGRGQLLGAGLPHPAPAVAAHAPGRDDRPVPAVDGLDRSRDEPAADAHRDPVRGTRAAARAGARGAGVRRPALHLPRGAGHRRRARLRRRVLQRPPPARAGRHLAARRARRDGGLRRQHGQRQEHADQAPAALLRHGTRTHPPGRRRHRHAGPAGPAARDRLRLAGQLPHRRHRRREHRVWLEQRP